MREYSRQEEEIATIRERTVKLSLSDADTVRLSEKAASVGLTVAELLQNFIGDLVDGTYSNGSDERMLANEWFNRCGFSFVPESTFIAFLIEWGDLQPCIDSMDYIADCERDLEQAVDADEVEDIHHLQEEIQRERETIEDYYREYQAHTKSPQTKEEALEAVEAYKEQLEKLREGAKE